MKKLIIYALAAFSRMCALFAACDDNIPGVDEFEPVPLTDVTLDPSLYNGLTMVANTTRSIANMVFLTPFNANDRAQNFGSDNIDIASVDGYGTITANAVGDCIISISVGEFSVVIPLYVVPFVPVHIIDLTLTKTRVTVALDGPGVELDMNTLITLYPVDANDGLMERFDRIDEKMQIKQQEVHPLDGDKLLDNQDMCQLLGITKRTLARYRQKKLVRYYTIRGRVWYKASEVAEFLKKKGKL